SIGEPQSNDRVSIFPLYWPEPSAPDYCLLSQAISENLAVVEEASENGDVPSLRLTSRCDRPILVPEGEILVGAKQNRVVNVTVLVAPFAKFSLPVSCVEQGRWRYQSREFASAACCAPPSLRSKKTRSVQRSRELTGSMESDQGQVWDEVAEGLRAFGVHSHTRSLADGFAAVEEELQGYHAEFSLPEHTAGVVVTTGSRIIGMDLFDSSETLSAVWDRLSRAYFFDALRGRKQDCRASRSAVEQFLARIAGHARRRFPAAGMGDELEIAADGIVGAALLHSGRICHLAAFSEQT
ncbi:MAG: hypothetical protein GX621_10685, partial [Pirellulaceae bacterium]|nr:hypothetical protein [Pirellulaceae bacterium]